MGIYILLLTILATALSSDAAIWPPISQVFNGLERFSDKLFPYLINSFEYEDVPNNVLVSPLSLHMVLSMLYQGAAGETQTVLGNGLIMDDSLAAAQGYQLLIEELSRQQNDWNYNGTDEVTVGNANKLYARYIDGLIMNSTTKDILLTYFNSEIEVIDVSDDLEAAKSAEKINDWVKEKTNNEIATIVTTSGVQGGWLILVNALYFKATWLYLFDEMDGFGYFNVPNYGRVLVKKMQLTAPMKYATFESGNIQVVSLPYRNDHYEMFIILTKDSDVMNKIDGNLENYVLYDNYTYPQVQITMPKIKIEADLDLTSVLDNMGMSNIFSDNADFSYFFGYGDFRVTKIVQKVVLEVNEYGSMAAAASAVKITSAEEYTSSFNVDRPFLFMITYTDDQGNRFELIRGRYTGSDLMQ